VLRFDFPLILFQSQANSNITVKINIG